MPIARSSSTAAAATPAGLVAAFAATLFLSAFLLFSVQPLFAKMILPTLGGSPGVWSVAMVFFQGVLLLGYGYAHWLTRRFGLPRAAGLHLAVMLVALFALPIGIAPGWTRPPADGQSLWLLGAFAVSVGLPFFAVAANGPLLQAWFARSGHHHADDPYFLYGASNVGSLLALLAYPFVVEPMLTLTSQSWSWTVGYGGLVAAVAGVGVLAGAGRRGAMQAETDDGFDRIGPPISTAQKLRWIGFAFVPSALLVAVTAHLSTDVAAAPFLWVVPLALFLLTFVITFQRKPIIRHEWMLGAHPLVAGCGLATLSLGYVLSWEYLIVLNLSALFVVAMMCHGELVRQRPDAANLTAFYLWMSFGGVLGGIFAGLIAPQVFSTVLEYPLLLLLSFFCRPAVFNADRAEWRRTGVLAGLLTLAVVGVSMLVDGFGHDSKTALLGLQILQVAFVAGVLILHRRPTLIAGLATAFFISALAAAPTETNEDSYRGFFGVHKVRDAEDGSHRLLLHGTTIHGVQRLIRHDGAVDFDREPLAYYHWNSPLAQAIKVARGDGRLRRAALIGLGAGALACHARPGEAFTVFEIDPLVVEIAGDPTRFGYLRDCPPVGGVVVGDARLTLSDQSKSAFDLIVLDAFSSDSVPVHLLTVEAMQLYMDKLADNGLLVFHVSNRNMALAPIVAAAARDLRLDAYHGGRPADPGDNLKYAAEVVVIGRRGGTVDAFADESGWTRLSQSTTLRAWTDDYSNVIGAIWSRLRGRRIHGG